ncbi:MAG: OmpA family protein [Bacteroidales bacterium]|nr:OmpA family protein [Bacteroidales bacterium]
MKIVARILILIIFSSIASNSFAQRRNPTKNADAAFDKKQYTIAAEAYKKAYNRVKKNPEERNRVSYRMAECYRLTGLYKRAEATYKRVLRTDFPLTHPEVYLHFAQVLKTNEKFEDAITYYELYAEAVPDDPRGKLGAETAALVQEWMENPSKYELSTIKKLNSRESDFGVTWASSNFNEIIFTSTRDNATGKEKDGYTGNDFSDLFTSRIDRKDEWSAPVLLEENEVINTKASEGAPFMNSAFNKMYFTRCNNEAKRISGCQIMVSTRSGRNWGEPVPVEIIGVDTLDIVGHPTLSENELIMYYAAERRGGFGKKDIWVSLRDDKSQPFSRPLNLGPVINTKGNEVFPFLRNDTTLYFSSDGHGGMGGLDIFVTTEDTAGNWGPPVNLKYPINSTADDFSIMFHPDEERGFLASNRDNIRGTDNLYYFIEPPVLFTLEGTVKDVKTLQFVSGASIQLVGSNGMSVSTRTNEKGYFLFSDSQMNKNTTYEIVVDKDNYFTATAVITTVGVEFSRDFVKDFDLEPIPEEPIVLPDILYDLARWELKPQYEDSLQGLIETLQENPTITVELASHTDSRDTDERNDVLSQRRAQSVVDYLIIRGIDGARLVAKGYGERSPRKLTKTITTNGFTFKEGTELTEDYVNSLESNDEKEAAHQLNRRTEFKVLSKDFVPKSSAQAISENVAIRLNPADNQVPFIQNTAGLFEVPFNLEGYSETFVYDSGSEPTISLKKALELLNKGIINKDNFKGEISRVLEAGNIADRAVIVFKNLRIANRNLENVEVTVFHNSRYDFTFGQKLLNQFGSFEFNTQKKSLIFK